MQMLCKQKEVVIKFGMWHNGISKKELYLYFDISKVFSFVSILINGRSLGLSNDIEGKKSYQILIIQWSANVRCIFTKIENLQPLGWN
jgi:hypothetical protein